MVVSEEVLHIPYQIILLMGVHLWDASVGMLSRMNCAGETRRVVVAAGLHLEAGEAGEAAVVAEAWVRWVQLQWGRTLQEKGLPLLFFTESVLKSILIQKETGTKGMIWEPASFYSYS